METRSGKRFHRGGNLTVNKAREALIEELKRLSAENKKLTDMLTAVCENYTELRNQLMEHTHTINAEASKKGKLAETSINNNIGPLESSFSDEDLSKKPKEEQITSESNSSGDAQLARVTEANIL